MPAWTFDANSGQCPACGTLTYAPLFRSTDALYKTTTDTFLVVRCSQCGLIRLTPPIPPERLHRYYPSKYWFVPDGFSSIEEAYRRFVLRDHIRFVLAAYRNAGGSGLVLDVGCGGGLVLGMVSRHQVRVAGMDISVEAAGSAWKINSVPAVCGTLEHLPILEGSCAVITMFHVVEHLHDPVTHLTAARLLLRKGGRLVLQVPNADSWQFHVFGKRWNGIDVPRHLINYRTQDLADLLIRCGFQIKRIKHFNLRDNPAGFATSVAPWLDPMARRLTGVKEGRSLKLFKSLLYLALTVAAVPFAFAEAIFRRGSSVMIEASVRDGSGA